jgi:hypothetical protein
MSKKTMLLVGAVALTPILVFVLVFAFITVSVGAAASAASGQCATSAGNAEPAAAGGGGLTVSTTAGVTYTLNAVQLSNAALIVQVGQSMKVPQSGLLIALMVAFQESKIKNLANSTVPSSQSYPNDGLGHDHDSLDAFQQRANWGTVAERMDPTYAARAFFGGPSGPNHGTPRGLLDIPGWQQMSPGEAAQTVQVSAYPDAYDQWTPAAQSVLAGAGGGGCTDTSASSWHAPNGKTGADLVSYAAQFVGKVPYSGACGSAGSPAGWCCTGFVYYVYHQVLGIDLDSPVVSGQLAMAHQIPQSQAQAGDLVAWVGYHIGIYDGHGGVIHSPDWGRMLTHTTSLFDVDGVAPTFWRVNAIGPGSW